MYKERDYPVIHAQSAAQRGEPIPTDVQGSYTGRPANPYEVPVQDADDL